MTLGLGVLAALAFALLTPPGQPYDEPAHWNNVAFYAEHVRMPTIGEPGSSYEAQMGPVYYAVSAVVASMFDDPGGEAAFRVVRLFWVALVPVLGLLTYELGRTLRLTPVRAGLGAALVGLNPLLLGIAGSIQNDLLSITLGAAVLVLAAKAIVADRLSGPVLLALGGLAGVAILTKVQAVSLVPALMGALLLDRRVGLGRRVLRVGVVLSGAALTSGWWFVRNVALYGDLTGTSQLVDRDYGWSPIRLDSLQTLVAWGGEVVSYLFLPVEYYRNTLKAPLPLKMLAPVVFVLLVAVVLRFVFTRRRRVVTSTPVMLPEVALLIGAAGFALMLYIGFCFVIWHVPFRLAFIAAPAVAVVVSRSMSRDWSSAVAGLALVTYLSSTLWLLVSLPTLAVQEFTLFAG